MQMRPSHVLAKLRSGGIVSCMKFNLADPRAVDLAGHCGFDCLWLDMEHVPNDLGDIGNQVRAAKAHDVDVIVRFPAAATAT